MIRFQAPKESIKEWFPETYDSFMTDLRSSKSKSSQVDEEKMIWFVSWGFFVKKPKTDEEKLNQETEFNDKMRMVYSDRIVVEIPKIRCSITLLVGNYYIKSDRALETGSPKFVIDMAEEIIKYTMVQEQNYFGYEDVIESLKEFENLFNIQDSEKEMSMDDILDKISATGMNSLTSQELKFLEKMSKN